MNIKIGDTIFLKNPYTNEDEEYDVIGIDMYGSCTCKRGLNTFVLTREYLEDFAINKKVKYMNFMEAVKELKTGKKVRRISWSNTEAHIKKVDGNHYIFFATIYNAENNQGIPRHDSYSFREYEILANDWEIYEEECKLHTFEEALKALKNGAQIYRKSCATQVHRKTDRQFLFYSYDDFEAKDWIIKERD